MFLLENRNKKMTFKNVRPFYKNPASASRALNKLQEKGYIRIVKHLDDKRMNFYKITLKGIFFCEIIGFGE